MVGEQPKKKGPLCALRDPSSLRNSAERHHVDLFGPKGVLDSCGAFVSFSTSRVWLELSRFFLRAERKSVV